MSKHRDPHAHTIHVPGKRLLHHVPLAFVRTRASGGGRRSVTPSLNMASFLDVLLVTVLFLLTSFSASAECPERNVRVPEAGNAEQMIDAPMISVSNGVILIDGVAAGSTHAIAEGDHTEKLDDLARALAAKRALWRAVQPNRPFPGACVLQIDRDVPAVVVKSVFQTAVSSGYPQVSFMVKKLATAR